MRQALIAANWKMNMTPSETREFLQGLIKEDLDQDVEVLVCPPSIDLDAASQVLDGSGIELGAQNIFYEDKGAFTGEVSPVMVKDLGVSYVILGHSERRKIFEEDDELINKKIKAASKHGLKTILCLGETLEQRENGSYKDHIKGQIIKDLDGLKEEELKDLVLAYEPIWAIGSGKTASADDAQEMASFIRELIASIYPGLADGIRILYGGSVKPENIKSFMAEDDIDGALVGGASLKVESFRDLVNF